jgi:hypothetical protein
MLSKKKIHQIKKKVRYDKNHPHKNPHHRRTVSGRAVDVSQRCKMAIIVFQSNDNRWHLHKSSQLEHSFHAELLPRTKTLLYIMVLRTVLLVCHWWGRWLGKKITRVLERLFLHLPTNNATEWSIVWARRDHLPCIPLYNDLTEYEYLRAIYVLTTKNTVNLKELDQEFSLVGGYLSIKWVSAIAVSKHTMCIVWFCILTKCIVLIHIRVCINK